MIMEPFEVYRYYLALRLHFTTDQYDVIAQGGRVKASKQSFAKRKDLLAIRKVAESYSDKEVVDFLVANFVSGDRWGGIFDVESKDRYAGWKKRMESMYYTFDKELNNVITFCEKTDITFWETFHCQKNEHPYIIKLYLRNSISIETLVILEKLIGYVTDLDQKLCNDLIWPDVSRTIKKYDPFVNIKKEKYDELLRSRVGYK